MNGPIVFCDTETTGLHVDRRPWEIALITRTEGRPDVEDLFQVRDVDLSNADPFGLSVGKFYERHCMYGDGPQRGAFLESQLARIVERLTRGATLVAANPAFDASVLDAMLRRHGYLPAWHYHLIDIEAMAIGALVVSGDPVPLPAKSTDLSRRCNVDPANYDRHTAMGDARWVRDWFDAIMPKAAS